MNINKDLTLKQYSFPSIGQYAQMLAAVNRRATFVGLDENQDPIYDKFAKKPVLKFIGSTKLHGTNAGIILDLKNNTIYYQSRTSVLSPDSDNAGFARYMSENQDEIVEMLTTFITKNYPDINWEDNIFAVYGEWCGGSIQKGVALNKLEKMFVIFAATIRTREVTESRNLTWITVDELKTLKIENKIYNIFDFKTWEIEIDFNSHHENVNNIIEWTKDVEEECPFAKEFNISGVGEGIVFQCVTEPYNTSDFWFKSKGDKHSKSKVKTLNPVDSEKINRLIAIAEKITPSWRLEQMFNETFDILNGGIVERERIGQYIKAVMNDIVKEEKEYLVQEGVQIKEIAKYVSKISTNYFFEMEKEILLNGK